MFRQADQEEEPHLRIVFQIRHQAPLSPKALEDLVKAILGADSMRNPWADHDPNMLRAFQEAGIEWPHYARLKLYDVAREEGRTHLCLVLTADSPPKGNGIALRDWAAQAIPAGAHLERMLIQFAEPPPKTVVTHERAY